MVLGLIAQLTVQILASAIDERQDIIVTLRIPMLRFVVLSRKQEKGWSSILVGTNQ